jgi:hypothetical protein
VDKKSAFNMVVRCCIGSEWALLHGYKALGERIEQIPDKCIRYFSPIDISLPVLSADQETTHFMAL